MCHAIHKMHAPSDQRTLELLQRCVSLCEPILASNEKAEVERFMQHDEYQLAAEALCFSIIDDGKVAPNGLTALLLQLPFQDEMEDGLIKKVERVEQQ